VRTPAHQRWSWRCGQEWAEFFAGFESAGRLATVDEVLGKARMLAKEFGFHVQF
jgi:hypothetical protein